MLLVKTYLETSTLENAGLGCFADEDIKAGQLIWKYDDHIDRKFTHEEYKQLSPIQRQFVDKYAYMHNGTLYLCVDNGRFFNHSNYPNTYESAEEQATYASREIKAGEEIFSDYTTFGITQQDLNHNFNPFDEN